MVSMLRRILPVPLILMIGNVVFVSGAFAQQQRSQIIQQQQSGGGSKVPPKKQHSVSFEEDLVEGAQAKPELFYLLQRRDEKFSSLIKIRQNFLPEMKRTGEDIGRAGRGRAE